MSERKTHGLISPEQLRRDVVKAVAGVVVSKDGKVLVGTEQVDKPGTRKHKGEVSIPFETLKPRELQHEGRLVSALLTEIAADENMQALVGSLDSAGIVDQLEVIPGDWVATLLLRFRQRSNVMPFTAPHPEEFSDLRWEELDHLFEMPNLREYARTTLGSYREVVKNDGRQIDFRALYLPSYIPSIYEQYRELEADVEVGGLSEGMSQLLITNIPHSL